MAVTTIETTDNLDTGRTKINNNFAQTLNKGVSAANGLYPTASLHQIPGLLNQDSTPFEMLNLGSVGTHTGDNVDRVLLPKGFVAINWSQNFVNNWKWNNALSRAEPYNVAFPMPAAELGGEGFLTHYTAPGLIPANAFHETTRFGGGVDGLSGVNPYTTYIPFNQFKATIFAQYRATTTPDAATEHPWWGGSGNALGGVLNPLLWLSTEETKGSGYNVNELARFSAYNSTAYPVVNFEKSGGTFQTKTAITTNSLMAQIGSDVYSGAAFERSATIDFVSRGTISAGNAGQSIRFSTSATNTAGLTSRVEITNDGLLKNFVAFRGIFGSVTGVPDYSGIGAFAPVIDGSTVYHVGSASTASGGVNIVGFTNVTASGLPFVMRGTHGHTAPTTPALLFAGCKHNGTTGFADLAATEIVFQLRNNGTTVVEVLGNGNTGHLVATPTAVVHIAASSTARASLCLNPGTAPTSPVNGDIWIDSVAHTMHVRINGVTRSINLT